MGQVRWKGEGGREGGRKGEAEVWAGLLVVRVPATKGLWAILSAGQKEAFISRRLAGWRGRSCAVGDV